MIPMNERYYNMARFFTGGYAVRSYELLERYGVMPFFLPGLDPATNAPDDIRAYKTYLKALMPELDKTNLSGLNADQKQAYVYACMLYPDLTKFRKTMKTDAAIRAVLARLNEIMSLSEQEQTLLAMHLRQLLVHKES